VAWIALPAAWSRMWMEMFFLDWTSGVLVTNVGHCHPDLVKAIQDAAARLLNNYECLNQPRGGSPRKAGFRDAQAPGQVLLPQHRQRGHRGRRSHHEAKERQVRDRQLLRRLFTGALSAAASVGGLAGPKKGYGPSVPGAIRVPFPYCYRCPFQARRETCSMLCLDYLDDAVRANSTGSLAGVMVRLIWRGRIHFSAEDGSRGWNGGCAEEACCSHWMRCNPRFGRTGKFFAMEWEGLETRPGVHRKRHRQRLPRFARSARAAKWIGALGKGEMSSTHGGNPVAGAAVCAVIDIMRREKLADNALRMGTIMKARLLEMQEKCHMSAMCAARAWCWASNWSETRRRRSPRPISRRKLIDTAARNGCSSARWAFSAT